MREKLEWLKLIIPGLILTGLVVTQVLGAGPDLQEIPDRLIVQNEDTEKVDVPVTSTKSEAENTQKEKKEKRRQKNFLITDLKMDIKMELTMEVPLVMVEPFKWQLLSRMKN